MTSSLLELFQIPLFLIAALLSSVRLEVCQERDFGRNHEIIGWKGDNVKALNDCDILSEKSTIHLDALVAKTQCVTNVRIRFVDSNKGITVAGLFAHPGKEIHLGNVLANKCLSHNVQISIHCNCVGQRLYETRFTISAMKCYDMERELNFTINERSKQVVINNEYFHISNKYVKVCMKSISLINSNGTEIDNAWRKE